MNNITELTGKTIKIVQPSIWKGYFELKHNDEVIATMEFFKFRGMNMIFKINNKEWEIYWTGFWQQEVAIREVGYEMPFAKYSKDFFKSKGTIYLPKGEQLNIAFNLFKGDYRIETLSGQCLVNFEFRFSFKEKAKIYIQQKSDVLDKYPWVIAVAWYISLRLKHISAAVIG